MKEIYRLDNAQDDVEGGNLFSRKERSMKILISIIWQLVPSIFLILFFFFQQIISSQYSVQVSYSEGVTNHLTLFYKSVR